MAYGATTRSAFFSGCRGAQGSVKTTLEGIRCFGHHILVDCRPPVTGTASMMVSSGPLNLPVLSVVREHDDARRDADPLVVHVDHHAGGHAVDGHGAGLAVRWAARAWVPALWRRPQARD
jgi:hypothetical protein